MKKKIGIILTPDERSKAYIQKTIQINFLFDKIIFLNDKRPEKAYEKEEIIVSQNYGFDVSIPVLETLCKHKLDFKEFNFVDINNEELIDHLKTLKIEFFVYAGGGILKEKVLQSGPKFLHLHPGIVPRYKGSTCFYYSIINEGKAGVTAFIMNEGLDTGDVICQQEFEKPNHKYLDNVYDPHIRSETLMTILRESMLENKNPIRQDPNQGETYFIIHPVLKHIAILSCLN